MPWLKLWTEARNDGKLWSMPVEARWTWFCLLCYAAEKSRTGKVDVSTAVLAAEICRGDESKMIEHIEIMKRLEIIEVTACNTNVTTVTMRKFSKRQKKRPSDAALHVRERVAKHRKLKRCDENVTTHVTTTCNDGNAAVTQKCNAELDISSYEERRIKNPPTPQTGDSVVGLNFLEPKPEPPEPPYPNAETSIWMVHPGAHPVDELESRRTWTAMWGQWKNLKLCVGVYEHQCWYASATWSEAIRIAARSGSVPTTIRYIETIASGVETDGIKTHEKPAANIFSRAEPPEPGYHQHLPTLQEKFGPAPVRAGELN